MGGKVEQAPVLPGEPVQPFVGIGPGLGSWRGGGRGERPPGGQGGGPGGDPGQETSTASGFGERHGELLSKRRERSTGTTSYLVLASLRLCVLAPFRLSASPVSDTLHPPAA